MRVTIHLPNEVQKKLISALEKADSRETGGILMGEHIGEAEFRIVDLTIQRQIGRAAFFVRFAEGVAVSLRKFFRRTDHYYRRFNYLGEWHSHPSFSLAPSQQDIQSMLDIVTDADTGANFVVLLIVQLNATCGIQANATAFLRDGRHLQCELLEE